ncbi:MAG TPA: nuclear transport factor 2 family protein [Gemmatimonadaceae bacterium]|nr:nuclear transport factor 2 family protein [Gemmatimonadaceae bacterium]
MRPRSLLLPLLLLAVTACVHVSVQQSPASSEAEIRATLDSTAAGWNRGDLPTYLAAYTPDASEMLADGVAHGVDRIEQTMKQGFWKSGRPLQQLHYEHVEVRMLGDDHALVTGQYVLEGADRPQRTGWFTTVWARTSAGWRMIHDHS